MDSLQVILCFGFLFLLSAFLAFRSLRKQMLRWRTLSDSSKERLRRSHTLRMASIILAEALFIGLFLYYLNKVGAV